MQTDRQRPHPGGSPSCSICLANNRTPNRYLPHNVIQQWPHVHTALSHGAILLCLVTTMAANARFHFDGVRFFDRPELLGAQTGSAVHAGSAQVDLGQSWRHIEPREPMLCTRTAGTHKIQSDKNRENVGGTTSQGFQCCTATCPNP